MRKNIHEVFEEFEKAKTKTEKIEILKHNSSYALRNVLHHTYDPKVEFIFEEMPKYRASDAPIGMGYSTIHQELDRVYLYEKNNSRVSPNLTEDRKKQLLIQTLECLEEKEAKIFANMLLKKQEVKGMNASIVKAAFPELF